MRVLNMVLLLEDLAMTSMGMETSNYCMVVVPLVLLLVPIIVQIIHLISLLLMMRQITGVLVGIMAIGVIGQLTLWIKRMAIRQ